MLSIILGSILLICTLLIGAFPLGTASQEKASNVCSLIAPAFAQEIRTSFLEEEAGIAAYTNTGQKIDLTKVQITFETVDKKTDTYIIGSVRDMQVFVHMDGWIVVYYLKDEPISNIIDSENYGGSSITSTKLEKGLILVCDAAEVGLPYVKYYNFKYPNANRLKIISESIKNVKGWDSNTFEIKIPSDFTVYERSWLHYQYWEYEPESYMGYNLNSEIEIDGNTINSMPQYTDTKYGQIIPTQLSPDIFHTIGLSVSNYHPAGYKWIGDNKGFIAIILVYQESAIGSPSSRIITRDADSILNLDLEPFSPSLTPTPTPTPTSIQTPTPVVSPRTNEYSTPSPLPPSPTPNGEIIIIITKYIKEIIVGTIASILAIVIWSLIKKQGEH